MTMTWKKCNIKFVKKFSKFMQKDTFNHFRFLFLNKGCKKSNAFVKVNNKDISLLLNKKYINVDVC